MFNNQRYLTRGVQADIPLVLQLFLWECINQLPEKCDDFQVFELEAIHGIQRIHHFSEQPEYDMLIDSIVGDEVLPRSSCVLMQEDALLAVRADHPLARRDSVLLADIREENFVSLRRDRPWARIIQKACNEVNFAPNIVAESDNPITLCDFVRCGLGVCFLPSRTGLPPLGDGIALVRVSDFAYTRHLYLHWCYNAYLPPHVASFRDFTVQWFSRLESAADS